MTFTIGQSGHVTEHDILASHLIDVRRYGAALDGVNDDGPALRLARDAASDAGGGVIYIPHGTMRVASTETASGTACGVGFNGVSDISIVSDGAIVSEVVRLFYFWGATPASSGTIATANADESILTLATPADAANFGVGDLVFIRTGSIAAGEVPDSEFNTIVSANPSTGVLQLQRPLSKEYVQEYYVSGSSGLSARDGEGGAVRFDVGVVDSITTRFSFRGGRIIHTVDDAKTFSGAWIDGFIVEDVRATVNGRFISISAWRDGGLRNSHIHTSAETTTNATTRWAFTTAFGSTDCFCDDNLFTSDKYVWIHINEGSARTRVARNRIINAPGYTDNNQAAINVANRYYDVDVVDNLIVNPSAAAGGYGIRLGASGLVSDESFCWVDRNVIRGGTSPGIVNNTPVIPSVGELNRYTA